MAAASLPAVVLAAGEGRRLAPLTNTRPKPMLPVANRPILEYVITAIREAGIDEIHLVVGYRQERIRNHFGDGDDWGVDISYIEQRRQLGTGHAVLQAEPHVDGPFLVFNGDRIVDPAIAETVTQALTEGVEASMAMTVVEHPSTFGVVATEGDRLVGVEEKPLEPTPSATINAGVYGFRPSIFDRIRATDAIEGELAITPTVNTLAEEATVRAVPYDGRWLDVTYLWDLPVVNATVVSGAGAVDEGGGRVAPSATIASDVALGPDVRVDPHCAVGGGTAIGPSATVDPNAVIDNAVVMADASIGAGSVVRNAVVGANATIGPNVTIQGGPGTVVVDGIAHADVSLGGVLGDNAAVGGGATFDPGTIVGDAAVVDAGTRLSGRIEDGARVRRG